MHGLSPLILIGDVKVPALQTRAQVGIDGEALLLAEVGLHHRTEECEGHTIASCDGCALGGDVELSCIDAEGVDTQIGEAYGATDALLGGGCEVSRQRAYSDMLLCEIVAEWIVLAHREAEGRLRKVDSKVLKVLRRRLPRGDEVNLTEGLIEECGDFLLRYGRTGLDIERRFHIARGEARMDILRRSGDVKLGSRWSDLLITHSEVHPVEYGLYGMRVL